MFGLVLKVVGLLAWMTAIVLDCQAGKWLMAVVDFFLPFIGLVRGIMYWSGHL